jgi:hypothetical protein
MSSALLATTGGLLRPHRLWRCQAGDLSAGGNATFQFASWSTIAPTCLLCWRDLVDSLNG